MAARGRLINNKISLNRKFNKELSSDTCRMVFMMTISHLDVEGRIHGDPQVLKSQVIPWREDITKEQIQEFIIEWVGFNFVKWYEVEQVKYLWFPSFKKNQPNLRADRETPSNIPEYKKEYDVLIEDILPESCRSPAGVLPEQLPVKINISKEKINKENINSDSKESQIPIHEKLCNEYSKIHFTELLVPCVVKEKHYLEAKKILYSSNNPENLFNDIVGIIPSFFKKKYWFNTRGKKKEEINKSDLNIGVFLAHCLEILAEEKGEKKEVEKKDKKCKRCEKLCYCLIEGGICGECYSKGLKE